MSEKECAHHEAKRKRLLLIRRILIGTLSFIIVILLIILITWLILRPQTPEFILQDATVFNFNLSTNPPNILSSVFQVTVESNNPNNRIGIYYDRLNIYAVYEDQQITYPFDIQPTYQDTDGVNIWSPFIYGNEIPIAPYIGTQLKMDKDSGGGVMLVVKMDGKVRWKVGLFVSGGYGLHVQCMAYLPFGQKNLGVTVENNGIKYNGFKYQLTQDCSVSV